jgi:hypothetical protein
MNALWAMESTPVNPPVAILSPFSRPSADQSWFEAPIGKLAESTATEALLKTSTESTAFTGHLGVLRQDGPTLERQRRYDFWLKQS